MSWIIFPEPNTSTDTIWKMKVSDWRATRMQQFVKMVLPKFEETLRRLQDE